MRRTLLAAVIGILITFYATGWPWNEDMSRQPAPAPYHGPLPAVKATLPVNGEFGWSRAQFEELYPSNPLPPSDSNLEQGQSLFMSYCMPCHGETGKGDGPVLQKMIDQYGYAPMLDPDLTSPPVMGMDEEGIESFMTSGVLVMPNFSKLLTDKEMQLVAGYVVNCLQGKQPQACP